MIFLIYVYICTFLWIVCRRFSYLTYLHSALFCFILDLPVLSCYIILWFLDFIRNKIYHSLFIVCISGALYWLQSLYYCIEDSFFLWPESLLLDWSKYFDTFAQFLLKRWSSFSSLNEKAFTWTVQHRKAWDFWSYSFQFCLCSLELYVCEEYLLFILLNSTVIS